MSENDGKAKIFRIFVRPLLIFSSTIIYIIFQYYYSLALSDKADENLVRPLPWLPFLLLIVLLRQLRLWLSLVSLLIGEGPVTASSLVYFIQTRRRKLRSIRLNGLKAIQRREEERRALLIDNHNSLLIRLGKLLKTVMCGPRIHCEQGIVVISAHNPAIQQLLEVRITTMRCCTLHSIYDIYALYPNAANEANHPTAFQM